MNIILATQEQLDDVVRLFGRYREFYMQKCSEIAERTFINQRLTHQDSTIFIAYEHDTPVGFVQLYPTFSSVRMQLMYILNDLYIDSAQRQKGYATALIEHAVHFSKEQGAIRITLHTQQTNSAAQQLYEKLGWVQEQEFYSYNFIL